MCSIIECRYKKKEKEKKEKKIQLILDKVSKNIIIDKNCAKKF